MPTLKQAIVKTQNCDETVEVRFADNGIGIEPEIQDQNFTPSLPPSQIEAIDEVKPDRSIITMTTEVLQRSPTIHEEQTLEFNSDSHIVI